MLIDYLFEFVVYYIIFGNPITVLKFPHLKKGEKETFCFTHINMKVIKGNDHKDD